MNSFKALFNRDQFRDQDYNARVSDNTLEIKVEHIVIKNPFGDSYPLSFSIIYNGYLISLFEPGKFVCHKLDGMERDQGFERKLNTKKFKYHRLTDGKLIAQANGSLHEWKGSKWVKSSFKSPLKEQLKIFEDDEFIVFRECMGEWGGTVFFFDKKSRLIHYTESSCANSVFKENGVYKVLTQLGHLVGSTNLKIIADPRNLPTASKRKIQNRKSIDALGYQDSSGVAKIDFSLFGLQLFSTFPFQGDRLYMGNSQERTVLLKIKGNELEVVHPLFAKEIYTHEPVTNQYGDYILMNLDYYGTGRDREVSCIVIHKSELIKIDWNKSHHRR
ncbi:MAG: hypothetical protein Roseis2KO_60140 [Roseivirga sp.]